MSKFNNAPLLTTSRHPPSIFYQIRLRTYLTPQRQWRRRNFSLQRFPSRSSFFLRPASYHPKITPERDRDARDPAESNDGIKGGRRPRGVVSVHWSTDVIVIAG